MARAYILGCVSLPLVYAWILAMALALAFGSFLNVCISRLPSHRSIVSPGSRCPGCGASIRPRDNVPVVSWVLLRGRCRACRQPISPRYSLVELGYASLVAGVVVRFGFTLEALAAACFCFFALGLLVMDLETMLLPDSLTLPGLALGLLSAFCVDFARGGSLRTAGAAAGLAGLAALGWALVLLAIRWAYYGVRRRHGLGLGDVKLIALLGAWLGASRTAVCFLLAVVGAALAGLAFTLFERGRARQQADASRAWLARQLPLGSFLCAAGLCAFFYGDSLLRWYLRFFSQS